ncbi:MAG: HEAT repeat domain-containing protein [Parcubacteria group bacterium]|nr:HEAT repeat domain-containing protein [Parcubacteria group bacterium]
MSSRRFDLEKYKAWLSSADPHQRAIALNVIWHTSTRGDEIDKKVARVLRTDNEVSIRRDAARALVSWQDSRFRDAFIEALDDEDWLVRGEALLGLKAIDPEFKKIPRVVSLVKGETHPYCRWCADIM